MDCTQCYEENDFYLVLKENNVYECSYCNQNAGFYITN